MRRWRRETSDSCAWQRFGNFFVTEMRGQIDDERKWPLTRWSRRVNPGGCFGSRIGPPQGAAAIARKKMPIGSIAQLPTNAHERGHVRKTHHGQVERVTLGVGARRQSVTHCVVNVSLDGLPIVLVPAGASRRTQLEDLNLLLRPKAFRKHRLEQVFATNQIFGREVLADDDQSHRALRLAAFGRMPDLLDVVTMVPAQIRHRVSVGVRVRALVARRAKEHQVFRIVGVLLRRCVIVFSRTAWTLGAGRKNVSDIGPVKRRTRSEILGHIHAALLAMPRRAGPHQSLDSRGRRESTRWLLLFGFLECGGWHDDGYTREKYNDDRSYHHLDDVIKPIRIFHLVQTAIIVK